MNHQYPTSDSNDTDTPLKAKMEIKKWGRPNLYKLHITKTKGLIQEFITEDESILGIFGTS